MKSVFRFFTSKYMIALAAFAVWMTFFDARDIFSQLARRNEQKQLREKIEYYRGEIKDAETELKNLKSNPATLEKYAREKYLMKKDNEEIFIEQ